MKASTAGERLAVLIDGDNVSSKVVAGLMTEFAKYGTASVKRIYGDWTSPQMKSWRDCLLEHSIVPMQQFAYTVGKNATDGAMIIDAMDLLYTGRFDSFCLVSSDSDFTRLAARIREQGISVYGFGNRNNTHRAFVAACNEFVYFDALPVPEETAKEPIVLPLRPVQKPQASSITGQPQGVSDTSQSPPTGPRALAIRSNTQYMASKVPARRQLDNVAIEGLRRAISSSATYDEDFVNLADLGHYLTRVSPDLNARNYGYERLSDFVKASGIVESKKVDPKSGGPPIALVRLKVAIDEECRDDYSRASDGVVIVLLFTHREQHGQAVDQVYTCSNHTKEDVSVRVPYIAEETTILEKD